jgi:hypothetical protein
MIGADGIKGRRGIVGESGVKGYLGDVGEPGINGRDGYEFHKIDIIRSF